MKKKLVYLLAACVCLSLFLSPVMAQDDETIASVNGRYQNLLMTLYVPDDYSSYGAFYEWGEWSGSSYAGYDNLPKGYWVYVYPNWYIWGSISSGGGTDADTASVNGKYYNLLTTLYVPDDYSSYGAFYEWGYWSGSSYGGYNNLPSGYWVYVSPNWYIWGNQR